MGEAVGTLETDLWASVMECSDGRKKALIKDINLSLSLQDLSSFAMPFLDGDVESTDKNASRKVGYTQRFPFSAVLEALVVHTVC